MYGSSLIQVWFKFGPGTDQAWIRYDQFWLRYGSGLVQAWYNLSQSWFIFSAGLVQVGSSVGSHFVQVWFRLGSCMVGFVRFGSHLG